MFLVDVKPSVQPVDHNTDICHICCDDDENKSLCGLDITLDQWNLNPEPADECVVCKEIAEYIDMMEEIDGS